MFQHDTDGHCPYKVSCFSSLLRRRWDINNRCCVLWRPGVLRSAGSVMGIARPRKALRIARDAG
jgi:hypothetical protein